MHCLDSLGPEEVAMKGRVREYISSELKGEPADTPRPSISVTLSIGFMVAYSCGPPEEAAGSQQSVDTSGIAW